MVDKIEQGIMRNVSLSNTDEKVPDKTAKTHCEANFEPVKPTRKVVQYRIVKICLWDYMWSLGFLGNILIRTFMGGRVLCAVAFFEHCECYRKKLTARDFTV